jgi:hypothetical protein
MNKAVCEGCGAIYLFKEKEAPTELVCVCRSKKFKSIIKKSKK